MFVATKVTGKGGIGERGRQGLDIGNNDLTRHGGQWVEDRANIGTKGSRKNNCK